MSVCVYTSEVCISQHICYPECIRYHWLVHLMSDRPSIPFYKTNYLSCSQPEDVQFVGGKMLWPLH